MNKNKLICILIFTVLSSCGGVNLDDGTYIVKHEIDFSTDPNSKNGEVFYSKWKISTTDNGYTLSINDGATELNGQDIDNKTVFYFNSSEGDDCPFYTHMFAELEKNEKGFVGTSSQIYDFCTVYNIRDGILKMESWATEYKVVGKLND